MAIADGKIVGRADDLLAATVQHQHPLDVAPGLAAMAAGIHRQRAAHRARNPGQEFGLGAALLAGKAGQLGRGDAGLGDRNCRRLPGAGYSARHG